ncbi:hypothetical protein ACPPVO_19425 [Dactylosporangium sp. McL0621]|uniref:hypothetical protein n=1 Tax=Dactylosporangium sp. McL0621 TaxID=3415678 RepID=UPI003CEE11C1
MRQRLIRRGTEEGTAAGIYGLIVSAAVMATSHAHSAAATAAAVLLTLAVYWSAERYARLVAERIHDGHRPSWAEVRRQLSLGWEIVTASALPLVVLVGLEVLRVEQYQAVLVALACNTGLLALGGWEIGRLGRLSTGERLASTAVAGSFGVALIVLKAALH